MNAPWQTGEPLAPNLFATVQRRTIFECCKWDPQVEDVSTLCNFPLFLHRSEWDFLALSAEQLAKETLAAEMELIERPDLHNRLGLSRSVKNSFRNSNRCRTESPRIIRFDFHYTTDGWKISEANTDVPGGFVEASGFTNLMAAHFPGTFFVDPVARLTEAIVSKVGTGATVALVHATAFADDRQVMVYLSRRLESECLKTVLVAPDHLRWNNGRASFSTEWFDGPADLVFRFFPGEWLPNLPANCGREQFFQNDSAPICNPATALLTQSKRFPLVWESLQTEVSAWKKFLPTTCDPKKADWSSSENWVLKPALGRVGEFIGLNGATDEKEWKVIRKSVRKHPDNWVAQQRFEAVPLVVGGKKYFPCFGIYTIDGRAAGIYGRISDNGLVNHRAQDIAVLVSDT